MDLRAVLRAALTCAKTEELVARNVAAVAKLPSGRRRSRPGKSWTSEETRAFLESARAASDALYAAYVLVLVLGLRKGEALGLAWGDVQLDAREVTICHQLQRVGGRLLHRETKTESSDATLPLPDICLNALALRQEEQNKAMAVAGPAWQPGPALVFTTRYGTPIEPRNFNRSFANRIASAGVPPITVHDARRTCASLLVDLDVHPRVAMQVLRHARISITMEIYARVSSKSTREALQKLGASLAP